MDRKTREKKKKTLILGDSIVNDIFYTKEVWRLNRRLKSSLSVKVISDTSTKGTSYYIKNCLIDCQPDVIILHHSTKDLSGKASDDYIASRIVALGRPTKNKYNQIYILELTVSNDKFTVSSSRDAIYG